MSPALDAVLPGARFSERHRRTVAASPEATWDAVLRCTGREIRALGPLMAIRMLPTALAGRRGDGPVASDPRPILSVFADAGWTWARRDERPDDTGGLLTATTLLSSELPLRDGKDDALLSLVLPVTRPPDEIDRLHIPLAQRRTVLDPVGECGEEPVFGARLEFAGCRPQTGT